MLPIKRFWNWLTRRIIVHNALIAILLSIGGIVVTAIIYPQFLEDLSQFLGLCVVAIFTSFALLASIRQAIEKVQQPSPQQEPSAPIQDAQSELSGYLSQLPPTPADFVGRSAEINSLVAATSEEGARTVGIFGMGGIGKTTLAHRFIEQRAADFPDGQIALDLMGLSSNPLSADRAAKEILRAHHPTMTSPETQQQTLSLYISALQGRHEIILLDNASDQAQVEAITPPPNNLLVITSRHHFTLPGMFRIRLDAFSAPEAEELILAISPRSSGSEKDIAAAAAYHPLAVRLVASALAVDESLDHSEYIRRLTETKERLSLVEATLELSVNMLNAELQSRWRSLSIFPGDFTKEAAQECMALGMKSAPTALSEFLKLSILEYNPVAERYRLHDLFRDFADDRLTSGSRDLTRWRHAVYFMKLAQKLSESFREGGEKSIDALRSVDIDWHNIVAARNSISDLASDFEQLVEVGAQTYGTLNDILMIRLPPGELVDWADECLDFAEASGDTLLIRSNLTFLGNALITNRQIDEAVSAHRRALGISKEVGDETGIAMSLGGLGAVYMEKREIDASVYYLNHAIALTQKLDDKVGQAHNYRNLGTAFVAGDDFEQAEEPLEMGLKLAEELNDLVGKAYALNSLGLMFVLKEENDIALDYFEESLELKNQLGDLPGQINTLINVAQVLGQQGDEDTAFERLSEAEDIAISIDSPQLEVIREIERYARGEGAPPGSE